MITFRAEQFPPPSQSLPDIACSALTDPNTSHNSSNASFKPKSRLKSSKYPNLITSSCKSVSFNPMVSERPRSESFSNEDISPPNHNSEPVSRHTIVSANTEQYMYFQNEFGQFYKVSSMWLKQQRSRVNTRSATFASQWDSSDSDTTSTSSSEDDEIDLYHSGLDYISPQMYNSIVRHKLRHNSDKPRPISCIPNYFSNRHSSILSGQSKSQSRMLYEPKNNKGKKFTVFSLNRKYKRKCKIS